MQKAGDDETQESCCNLLFHRGEGCPDDFDVDGVLCWMVTMTKMVTKHDVVWHRRHWQRHVDPSPYFSSSATA